MMDGQMDLSLTGSEFVYAGFDEERYNIMYNDGSVEPLTSRSICIDKW